MNSSSHVDSLLASAISLKASGDASVKSNDYQRAIAHYTKIFAYLNGLEPDQSTQAVLAMAGKSSNSSMGAEQKNKISELLLSTKSNLCLCYAKFNDFDKVILYSSQILASQPDHAKALFRRGSAYRSTRRFDESRADLMSAARLLPNDAGIRAELLKLKDSEIAEDEKMRKQFAGMFAQ